MMSSVYDNAGQSHHEQERAEKIYEDYIRLDEEEHTSLNRSS